MDHCGEEMVKLSRGCLPMLWVLYRLNRTYDDGTLIGLGYVATPDE